MPKTKPHSRKKSPLLHPGRAHATRRLGVVFVAGFVTIMVLAGLSRLFAAQAAYSLLPTSQTATAGQNKAVAVYVNTGNNGIRYGTVRLIFNTSHLSVADFQPETSPYTVIQQQSGNGFYSFNYYHQTTDQQGNFKLGTLTLKTKSVANTTNTPINFDSSNTTALSSTVGYVSVSFGSAAIRINPAVSPPPPNPQPQPPSPNPSPQPNPPPVSPNPTPRPPAGNPPSLPPANPPAPPPAANPPAASPSEPSGLPVTEPIPGFDTVNEPLPSTTPSGDPSTARARAILIAVVSVILAAAASSLYMMRHRIAQFFARVNAEKEVRSSLDHAVPAASGVVATRAMPTKPSSPAPKHHTPEKHHSAHHEVETSKIKPLHKEPPLPPKPPITHATRSPQKPKVTPIKELPPEATPPVITAHAPKPAPPPSLSRSVPVRTEPADPLVAAAITPEVLQDSGVPPLPHSAWEELRQKQEAAAQARKNKSILNEDAPDMFEIAQEHPESFGNSHFEDEQSPQK